MSITESIAQIDNQAFRTALAHFYARCSLAHQIIELPEFTKVIHCARHSDCELPNRQALRKSQLELAQSLRARLVRQLRNYCTSSPLTVAVDGWTNVNKSKVTNIVILCGGESYYWCSIVNARNKNSALWLRDPLVEVLQSIRGEGLVFSALVADNENVNNALYDLVKIRYPFLVRSPCAAHLVQLCVLKALDLPHIDPILTEMETLLGQFRKSKEYRLKLRQVQEAATGTFHTLLRPCDTRWSSQLFAAERLVKLKSYVDLVMAQEASFWSNLEEVIRFLKPFQVATDVMQKDSSTLYDTYQQFKTLLRHVKDTKTTSFFHPVKDDIVNLILDTWEKHVNLNAVIACAQLSFDTAVDTIFAANIHASATWFQDFAAKYAQYWNLASSDEYDILRKQAKLQWSNFLARKADTCFSTLDSDIRDMREEHAREQKPFDPRTVWNLHLHHAPVLVHAAVALLSIAGSEAAVERTFSAQDEVHCKRRNRLGDASVEAEMFIKFNERTVSRVEDWQGEKKAKRKRQRSPLERAEQQVAEMGDDYEEDEDRPSIAGLFKRPEPRRVEASEGKEEKRDEQRVEEEDECEAPMAAAVSAVPAAPLVDPVQAFIAHYVKEHGIHSKYRWKDWEMQVLEQAGQAWVPKMKDTTEVLKRKIMAWLRNTNIDIDNTQVAEPQPSE
jgi:Protein of unknown function (DUF 659)/hAT family C-terminal dimerisation region